MVLVMFAALSSVALAAKKEATKEKHEGGWLTSYEKALAASKESGKPILMDFTGSDWCGYCIKLHGDVFSKEEFKTWAKENIILLELDFPHDKSKVTEQERAQNAKLGAKYKVQGYPTCICLTADEKELGKIVGYSKPEAWMAKAKALAAKK